MSRDGDAWAVCGGAFSKRNMASAAPLWPSCPSCCFTNVPESLDRDLSTADSGASPPEEGTGSSNMPSPLKNEESLRKWMAFYMDRIEKERHRYQALEALVEEKLGLYGDATGSCGGCRGEGEAEPAVCMSRAYQEIAKVQRKAEAEELASQARLRQEQMRVHWLEKDLEQKVGTGLRPWAAGGASPYSLGPALSQWPCGLLAPRLGNCPPPRLLSDARPGATWVPAARSEHWETERSDVSPSEQRQQ